MSNDHDLRQGWRISWLSSIQEFADDEAQRRLWLDRNNTNPHFSFVEYMCSYFDDLDLSDGGYERALSEGLVSKEEAGAVSEFHRLAHVYDSPTDDYDHETILADEKWADLVEAAKRAKASLLCLIHDPQERQVLTES